MESEQKEMAMKILDTKLAPGQQDVNFERLYATASGEKLRVRIRSNAYDFQCSAGIKIFDPASRSWNPLAHIDPPLMKTQAGLCYRPAGRPATVADFAEDEAELLRQAKLIL